MTKKIRGAFFFLFGGNLILSSRKSSLTSETIILLNYLYYVLIQPNTMPNAYIVSYLLIMVLFPTGRGRCMELVYYTVKALWRTNKYSVASQAPGTAVSPLRVLAHSSSQQP